MFLLVLYVLYVLVFAVSLAAIAVFIQQTAIKAIFLICYPMRLIV
jgi:hypothetical protein